MNHGLTKEKEEHELLDIVFNYIYIYIYSKIVLVKI